MNLCIEMNSNAVAETRGLGRRVRLCCRAAGLSLLVAAAAGPAVGQGLSVNGHIRFSAYAGEGFDGPDNGFFDWNSVANDYSGAAGIVANGYPKAQILNILPGQGDNQVTQLDFATDGRMSFDLQFASKSGLAYGGHWELDFLSSDVGDVVGGDYVAFNDGYAFINSTLGDLRFGDTGSASYAENQLHVPLLVGAREISFYTTQEL